MLRSDKGEGIKWSERHNLEQDLEGMVNCLNNNYCAARRVGHVSSSHHR